MFIPFFLFLSFLSVGVWAFDASSSSNVAVYWGQNSAGTQTRLKDYCDQNVDIVLLSFLYSFPDNLQVDFANMCSETFSDGLRKCDQIGEDIEYCQNNGKIVLLSMGGSTGSYGFTSDTQGTDFATTLWNKFGGGSDDERPFGDAIVDGFDFDFEQNDQTGTVALGNALRQQYKKDTSKTYYLSAAPQCPYPDASVGDLMSNVDLDFAFIQFYNNYCNLGTNFNWDTWQDYADNTSPNKNIKLYLGQPGGPTGAGSGYNSISTVKTYVDKIKLSGSFGGVSLWDASQAFSNVDNGENYAEQLKEILGSSSGGSKEVDTSTTSTTSTSTSKTTTSTSTSKTTSSSSTTSTSTTSTSTTSTSTTSTSTTSTSTTSNSKISTSTTSTITSSSTPATTSTSTSTSASSSSSTTSTSVAAEVTSKGSSVTTAALSSPESVVTKTNSIFTTRTTEGKVLTITNIHTQPTTVTTVRIIGTTFVATQYVDPPNM